jgi:hypothetical protein
MDENSKIRPQFNPIRLSCMIKLHIPCACVREDKDKENLKRKKD